MTCWTHPQTGAEHSIRLARCNALGNEELNACFRLIEQTSRDDYENSTAKWHAPRKLKEMRSPDLRYIVVEEAHTGTIRAFTSLMPTFEEGQPVIYCYEIHLAPELQGTGLGSLLMSFHATVAANLPPVTKVMLTCFLSNQRALGFYRKLGFEKDAISPEPRTLRGGTTVAPDYVIMSKTVRSRVGDSAG
ncbi:acyl-CoA N-acyltransferase [Trichocladium antarcticum]|uniref:N-alpha-acetyltransferase 40 n=1 Tax=Trichocladium antarcticum TaxID=1450529 RepID=A0AAN6UPD6_9PEZI|nr:acyl-CoA N-acyltransferase [Trichocladium antarcticum]